MEIEFSRPAFEKKATKISNFMKIRLVGAELFHVDGQAGRREEANIPISQFCKRAWK